MRVIPKKFSPLQFELLSFEMFTFQTSLISAFRICREQCSITFRSLCNFRFKKGVWKAKIVENAVNRQKNSVSLSKTAVSYSIFELRLCSLHRKLRFFMVNLQFERKQFHHCWIYVRFYVYFTVDKPRNRRNLVKLP